MRHTCSILLLAAGLAAGSVRAQVAIEGTVQLPKPSVDRGLNQRYSASADIALAPTNPPAAVVYLEGDFRSTQASAAKTPAQVAQKNIAFAPDLLPVLVGTAVEFPNMDDTYHNVFSYSKTKRFDLGRYRKDEKPTTVVFDKPGAVTIHCEIHERMRGTILVLETPYFQKTDPAGRYRLEHLPAGSYVLKAWVAGDDVRQRPVELKTGMTFHVDFPAK
ncbi:MAG TPA: carboxypeptidase regulatory-like domain-containing protein [Chthoniobacterales bacterium]|nr:carboxypeptidase regulatory-like domain-containing protein [Chthoniobacterales bacterium]